MPAAEPQRLRLDALDPKDLSMLQQQLQEELQGLGSSTVALQKVAGELGMSGAGVERLKDRKAGQQMLLPLTSSLYVNGTLDNVDTVLVELGTGYYAEKSLTEAMDYFQRKLLLLRDELDKIGQAMSEKQRIHEQVVQVLRRKQQAAAPSKS
ncbi:hypothetical protein WJX73_002932 [Symbiochloris irregularis]|uniref:Prefoldin subunit 5 n=1 Tax=Symbiochloris irregularis TaxID=706552 RepID=A0AAW1NRE0_9CHLO